MYHYCGTRGSKSVFIHPTPSLYHGGSNSTRDGPRANSLALHESHKEQTCSSSSERPAKEAGKVFLNLSVKRKKIHVLKNQLVFLCILESSKDRVSNFITGKSRFLEPSVSRTSRYFEPNPVSLGFASLKLYNFTPDFSNPRFLETPDNSNQFLLPWEPAQISRPLSADVNYIHRTFKQIGHLDNLRKSARNISQIIDQTEFLGCKEKN